MIRYLSNVVKVSNITKARIVSPRDYRDGYYWTFELKYNPLIGGTMENIGRNSWCGKVACGIQWD
jgi:hypothetical protein